MKVFAFASPCIVSWNIAEKPESLLKNKVFTVNLGTDVVTRLSLESLRQGYKRMDLIKIYPKDVITSALKELNNPRRLDELNSTKKESALFMFLDKLKSIDAIDEESKLYPLGTVLWFVPKVCLESDICKRRAVLMDLKTCQKYQEYMHSKINENLESETTMMMVEEKDNNNNNNNNKKEEKEEEEKQPNNSNWMTGIQTKLTQSMSQISNKQNWQDFINYLSNEKVSKEKQITDIPRRNEFVVFNATTHRHLFQQFVFEFFDGLYYHLPQRYLGAVQELCNK